MDGRSIPPPPFLVREATSADLESLLPLRRALWPHCPDSEHRVEMASLLASDGTAIVASDSSDKLLGFAELSLRRDSVEGASGPVVPYLEGWFVIEEARGRGIGRLLIATAEAWAARLGFTELASDAEIEDTGSIAAHGKLGFREVERTVHFIKRLLPGNGS